MKAVYVKALESAFEDSISRVLYHKKELKKCLIKIKNISHGRVLSGDTMDNVIILNAS